MTCALTACGGEATTDATTEVATTTEDAQQEKEALIETKEKEQ